MNKVKVVFVGCGNMANVHYNCLCRHEEVELVGCYDIDAEKAESWATPRDVPLFKSVAALYDATHPHAAYIMTPPDVRGPVEIETAQRGIHLFIEKPVALDIKTARAVGAALRKAKVLSSVGYCFRYCEAIQTAQQWLKGKAPSLIAGACHGGLPQADWWRHRARSGGQIVEQTTHLIDLLRFLCGPIAEVHALAAQGCMSKIDDYDVDDSSVLTLRLKTGAVACISSTCIMSHPGRTSLEIITPERSLLFDGAMVRVREDHKAVEHYNAADMYVAENAAFIKAVQQGRRTGIRSTYADALKTLRVTLAANESIATGLLVAL